MKHYIYGLVDPISKDIRYVGQTTQPSIRYTTHLTSLGGNTHKENWIRQYKLSDQKPTMTILEECDETNWKEREKWWIAYGREQRWPLTNATKGGDGIYGYKFSAEQRQENSAKIISKWKDPAWRANQIEKHKGYIPTKEQREKQSKANKGKLKGNKHKLGWTASQETRDKQSESLRGKNSKLTKDLVLVIKRMIRDGFTQSRIAGLFGVDQSTISKINKGAVWSWVNEDN